MGSAVSAIRCLSGGVSMPSPAPGERGLGGVRPGARARPCECPSLSLSLTDRPAARFSRPPGARARPPSQGPLALLPGRPS